MLIATSPSKHVHCLWVVMMMCGCTGELSANGGSLGGVPSEGAGAGGLPSPAPPVGSGAGGVPGVSGMPPATCDGAPAKLPLGRLTSHEYANAVRDLFPKLTLASPGVVVDDRGPTGFDNGAAFLGLTDLSIERYESAAQAVATQVAKQMSSGALCQGRPARACGRAFVEDLASRAYRRPLSGEERTDLQALFGKVEPLLGPVGATEFGVSFVLQSPNFLYKLQFGNGGQLTPYELASKLSFLIWGSIPDAELLQAAAGSQLATPEQLSAQTERMLLAPAAVDQFAHFANQWMVADAVLSISKSPVDYPEFEAHRDAIHRDGLDFLRSAVAEPGGSLQRLLTGRGVFADGAAVYGVAAPNELPSDQRAGYLTRPSFLAPKAGLINGIPPLRGVFVLEHVLCTDIPSPPANIDFSAIEKAVADPSLTEREAFAASTSSGQCVGCHTLIDAVGFAFQHYDAVGGYRAIDKGKPIDATGTLNLEGFTASYRDAVEMSALLADSPRVAQCAARHYLTFAERRALEGADDCLASRLGAELTKNHGEFRMLLSSLVADPKFAVLP